MKPKTLLPHDDIEELLHLLWKYPLSAERLEFLDRTSEAWARSDFRTRLETTKDPERRVFLERLSRDFRPLDEGGGPDRRYPALYFMLLHMFQWLNYSSRPDAEKLLSLAEAVKSRWTSWCESEHGWPTHRAALRHLPATSDWVGEPPLEKLWQPLRAWYTDRQSTRSVVDVGHALRGWLIGGDVAATGALRVVVGGPGAGKTSLGRMLASHIATERPPAKGSAQLLLLDHPRNRGLVEDLRAAVTADERPSHTTLWTHRGAVRVDWSQPLAIIIDGLDAIEPADGERSKAGDDRVDLITGLVTSGAAHDGKLRVVLLDRDVHLSPLSKLSEGVGCRLHLMPYYTAPGERWRYHPQGLLDDDLRTSWRRKYVEHKTTGIANADEWYRMLQSPLTTIPGLNHLLAIGWNPVEADDRATIGRTPGRPGVRPHPIGYRRVAHIYDAAVGELRRRTLNAASGSGADAARIIGLETPDGFVDALGSMAVDAWHGKGLFSGDAWERERARSPKSAAVASSFHFRQDPTGRLHFAHEDFADHLLARKTVGFIAQGDSTTPLKWQTYFGHTLLRTSTLPFLYDCLAERLDRDRRTWVGKASHPDPGFHAIADRLNRRLQKLACSHPSEAMAPGGMALLALASLSGRLRNQRVRLYGAGADHQTREAACAWLRHVLTWPDTPAAPIVLASLSFLVLDAAPLDGLNAPRACLVGSRLSWATLRKARLEEADLRGTELDHAVLDDAELKGACLAGAILCSASLVGAKLESASLRGIDGCRARLKRASLQRADLRRADLRGADLRGADLRGADLRGADLRGAKMTGCVMDELTQGIPPGRIDS